MVVLPMGWLHDLRSRRTAAPLAVGLLTALAVAGWALGGWDGDDGSDDAAGHRYLVMGTEGQIALGQVVGDILADRHGGPSRDATATERLESIADDLVYGTVASTTLYDFEVELLADSETPAVYALPGGRILVTTAMAEVLEDDGELAAVVAEQIGLVMHDAPTHALAEAGLLDAVPSPATLEALDLDAAEPADRRALEAVADYLEGARYPHDRQLRAAQTALEVLDQSGHDAGAAERAARTLGEEPRMLGAHFDLAERLDLIREARAARESQSG